METSDLIKKVRKIEIKTRGLSKNVFAGEYHSAFKGRGMAFSEVREYHYGDDIRNIDWNVTARFNHPYIKVFDEERELTVMLLIDVSGSGSFGTQSRLKKDLITELAAVLSFSAIQNNDKIGAILFSDKIEKFISPQKGRTHTLRIIRELLEYKPESTKTDISEALRYLSNVIKKKSTAFIISDFIDTDSQTATPRFSNALRIANKKHDIVGINVFDIREREMPSIGLVQIKDSETLNDIWVDTSSKKFQNEYARYWKKYNEELSQVFLKSGVDWVSVQTDQDYVKPLINLFKRREKL